MPGQYSVNESGVAPDFPELSHIQYIIDLLGSALDPTLRPEPGDLHALLYEQAYTDVLRPLSFDGRRRISFSEEGMRLRRYFLSSEYEDIPEDASETSHCHDWAPVRDLLRTLLYRLVTGSDVV